MAQQAKHSYRQTAPPSSTPSSSAQTSVMAISDPLLRRSAVPTTECPPEPPSPRESRPKLLLGVFRTPANMPAGSSSSNSSSELIDENEPTEVTVSVVCPAGDDQTDGGSK